MFLFSHLVYVNSPKPLGSQVLVQSLINIIFFIANDFYSLFFLDKRLSAWKSYLYMYIYSPYTYYYIFTCS